MIDLSHKPEPIRDQIVVAQCKFQGRIVEFELEKVSERIGSSKHWHEVSSIDKLHKAKRITPDAFAILKQILRM